MVIRTIVRLSAYGLLGANAIRIVLEGNRSPIGKCHGRQRTLMPFHIGGISPIQRVSDVGVEKRRTYPLGKYGELIVCSGAE